VAQGFSPAIRVRRAALDAIVHHARTSAPAECCGILIGEGDDVAEAAAARNIASDPVTRFLIDPKSHFDALRAARQRGLDIVGFYHSHPRSVARPSATDVAEASYPDHLFLIVGLTAEPPEIGLYRFAQGNFLPIPFVTVP
jgi:proteasome lid subunit RPN8/RPN11